MVVTSTIFCPPLTYYGYYYSFIIWKKKPVYSLSLSLSLSLSPTQRSRTPAARQQKTQKAQQSQLQVGAGASEAEFCRSLYVRGVLSAVCLSRSALSTLHICTSYVILYLRGTCMGGVTGHSQAANQGEQTKKTGSSIQYSFVYWIQSHWIHSMPVNFFFFAQTHPLVIQ